MNRNKKPAGMARGGNRGGVLLGGERFHDTPEAIALQRRFIAARFGFPPHVAALVAEMAFAGRAAR